MRAEFNETQPLQAPTDGFTFHIAMPGLCRGFLSAVLPSVSLGTTRCLDEVGRAGRVNSPEVGKGRTLADTEQLNQQGNLFLVQPWSGNTTLQAPQSHRRGLAHGGLARS